MDGFYVDGDGSARMGDIVLCGVARVVDEDWFCPPHWGRVDEFKVSVNEHMGESARPIHLYAGVGLAMVVSHDCHLDKEWNRQVRALMKGGASQQEAEATADADQHLDRTFTVSPLVATNEVPGQAAQLMKGKVLGYFPVPEHPRGLIPEQCVVDLSYRCTVDRMDAVPVSAISDAERIRLRYALMQYETLRSAELGFEVEQVVGRTITDVKVKHPNPLNVQLELDDGKVLQLVQNPAPPDESAPAREGDFYGG